jgi:S-adenosylmethionine hydrolase
VRDGADAPVSAWRLTLRPARLSASFHGRDLFAPAAAMIATGHAVPGEPIDPAALVRAAPPDPATLRVLYIDAYGNAMLDRAAADLPAAARLSTGGTPLPRARTFADVPPGTPFWYENSLGLAEIAVSQGNAARTLGLAVGTLVDVS